MTENAERPRPRLFVSYAHADESDGRWKTKLLPTLRALWTGGKVDFFEDDMIEVGDEWDDRLRRELDSFDLVVFLVSTPFLASGYIETVEVKRALERHEAKEAHILPILVKPCDWTYRNWAKVQAFPRYGPDARPLSFWEKQGELDEGLLQISERIRAWAAGWQARNPALALRSREHIPTAPPYRGLFAFQPEDEADFFGREALTDTLWTAVCSNRLTLLTGASGSGKSSLVNAGIIPRLGRHGGWCLVRARPGETPIDNLARALAAAMLPNGDSITITDRAEDLAGKLKAQPDRVMAYARTHRERHGQALFLILDQFEETYNLAKPKQDGQHDQLIDLLLAIAESPSDGPVSALLAMRADFQPALLDDRPELVDAVQRSTVMMRRMTAAGLADAIAGPARRRGVMVEDSLLGKLVSEVAGNPDALPLLEATLETLWNIRADGPLTLAAYEKLDGLAGALAARAEAALNDPAIDEYKLRRLLLELVHIDPKGGIDTVTRQPHTRTYLDDFDPTLWFVGEKLAAQRHRLLVIARDDTVDDDTLDITHEALFRRWDKLAKWIEDERDFLLFRQRLDQRVIDFEANGGDPGYYLFEKEISRAQGWLAQRSEALRGRRADFIANSAAHWADAAAGEDAKALWGPLNFRPLQSGDFLDRDELDGLLKVAQSSFLTRKKFLQLAISKEEYAKKFNRQPYLVTRSAVIFDEKLASSLIPSVKASESNASNREVRLARLTIALLVLPLAPDLAKFIFDEARPHALMPSQPEQSTPPIITDAIFTVIDYLDEQALIDLIYEAISVVNRLDAVHEASGPFEIVKAVFIKLEASFQRTIFLEFLNRASEHETNALGEHIVWMARFLSEKNKKPLDLDVAELMVSAFQAWNSYYELKKLFPIIATILHHNNSSKSNLLIQRIGERFVELASNQEQTHLLAETLAALPLQFRGEPLTHAAVVLFETSANVLIKTRNHWEFCQSILVMALINQSFNLPTFIVERNMAAIDQVLKWTDKSTDFNVLIALSELFAFKKDFDPASYILDIRQRMIEFLFDPREFEEGKLSLTTFIHIMESATSENNAQLLQKIVETDDHLLSHRFRGSTLFHETLKILLDKTGSPNILKIFSESDTEDPTVSFLRIADSQLLPLLPKILSKLEVPLAERILNALISDIERSPLSNVNYFTHQRSIFYLKNLGDFLSPEQNSILCNVIVSEFFQWIKRGTAYFSGREKVSDLALVGCPEINEGAILYLAVETLKMPLAGDPVISNTLLKLIVRSIEQFIPSAGMEVRSFWAVMQHLAELKAAHPDWDWLDLARPPLPPDELVATFRRLCADPPAWQTA